MATNYIFTPASNLILLHFENIAGGYTKNSGIFSMPLTNVGLNTSGVSKFGGISLYASAPQQTAKTMILTSNTGSCPDFDFQSSFTLDFWIRFGEDPGLPGPRIYLSNGGTYPNYTSYTWNAWNNPQGQTYMIFTEKDPFGSHSTGNVAFTRDTNWHHVALIRYPTNPSSVKMFLDGTQIGSTSTFAKSNVFVPGTDCFFQIYASSVTDPVDVRFDEVALAPISKWSGNFTVPVAAYTH
jgi:hypothetical protein